MFRTEIIPGIRLEGIEEKLLSDPFRPEGIVDIFEFIRDDYEGNAVPRWTRASVLLKYTSDMNRYIGAEVFGVETEEAWSSDYDVKQEFLSIGIDALFHYRRRKLYSDMVIENFGDLFKAFLGGFAHTAKLKRNAVAERDFFTRLRGFDWETYGISDAENHLMMKVREAAFDPETRQLVLESAYSYPL